MNRSSGLYLANILLIFLIGLITFGAVIATLVYRRSSLISPLASIPFFSFLYLSGWVFFQESIGKSVTVNDFLLIIVGLLSVIFFSIGGLSVKKVHMTYQPLSLIRIKLTALFLVSLGLSLFSIVYIKYGFVFFVSGKGVRNLIYQEMGFEKFAKDFLVVGVFLLNYYYLRVNKFLSILYLSLLLISILLLISLEVRSALSIIMLSFIYFYDKYVTKIANYKILLLFLLLISLGAIAKELFYALRQVVSSNHTNPQLYRAIYSVFINHEFYAWFEIFQNLKTEFVAGDTFLRGFLSVFQPSFMGGEGFSATQWYANKYLPDIAKQGFGRGFSFIVELYINFTIIGMLLIMFLFGRGLAILERSERFLIPSFCVSAFPFIWTGSSSILLKQYFLIYFIPAYLVYNTLTLVTSKRDKHSLPPERAGQH